MTPTPPSRKKVVTGFLLSIVAVVSHQDNQPISAS